MSEQTPDPKIRSIRIKVDDQIAAGIYANVAVVTHSDSEFVLDFIFIQPGRLEAKVGSRVIMSPRNAKRLASLFNEHIRRYEERFGEIPMPQGPTHQLDIQN